LEDHWHAAALVLGGRDQYGGAAGGLPGSDCFAVEPLVAQQVARWWPSLQQARGNQAFVDGGGTMPQARTIREPTSVLIASRKP